MGSQSPPFELPLSSSSELILTHPTTAERTAIWTLDAKDWGRALTVPTYLGRQNYLLTVPLAHDGGITHWVLVPRSLPPDERPILASCESLRKPALLRTANGEIKDVITHCIGSVFCNPEYRGRRYAQRMLKDLGEELKKWQTGGDVECKFSLLYSDIGKKFYAGLGWHPFPSSHLSFPPATQQLTSWSELGVRRLEYPDIRQLCEYDERVLRKQLADTKGTKTHVALLPSHDTMQWHHLREDFVTNALFGRSPTTKGAIGGRDGARVWAVWTRSFYGPLIDPKSGNTLHILRLVIEDESDAAREENTRALRGILELARDEAREWQLGTVQMWNPTAYVERLVEGMEIGHEKVDREEESIASLMWYGEGEGKVENIDWVWNEKYGWC